MDKVLQGSAVSHIWTKEDISMMKIIDGVSHLDHGLREAHIEFLWEYFGTRDGFFIETVELPEYLEALDCGLHGPLMGDAPVPETEVIYQQRGDRPGKSRMVRRPLRQTRLLSVIAGPIKDGERCVLYTAFGGPVAPREPFDSGLDDKAKAESTQFWDEHALSV